MAEKHESCNRVKARRQNRGWPQEELARRAGISRTAVSAIEVGRIVPSVAAALSLAAALGCTVEELFGGPSPPPGRPEWAWPPGREPSRYWHAEVGGRTLLYPVEPGLLGAVAHDGIAREGRFASEGEFPPQQTLVIACCDPAAGLLAAEYARASGFRLLVLPRSSGQALSLLGSGLVHVAGIHLATAEDAEGNAKAVRGHVSEPMNLLRVARWEEGLVLDPTVSASTVGEALQARLSWVGREPGSGARRCLDQLRPSRPAPRRVAYDHRGVAEAIRCGWAEAGVCLRLAGEEAGLRFLGIQVESYDLCYPQSAEADPRIQALVRVVRERRYRKLIGELPGYDAADAGEIERVIVG
ncbi:substrate-binding domain-containing protein [Tautonia sp. JC769]|uniref:substrate-binding domain-containing protein n=1 Tax=Tautonia sp. JC769 TaxID=3232135 RepID=UPI0034586C5B